MVPLLHGDQRPGIQPHRDSVLALASPPAEKTEVIQLKLLNVSLPAPPRLSFLCASFSLFCLREHACFCSLYSLQRHHSSISSCFPSAGVRVLLSVPSLQHSSALLFPQPFSMLPSPACLNAGGIFGSECLWPRTRSQTWTWFLPLPPTHLVGCR